MSENDSSGRNSIGGKAVRAGAPFSRQAYNIQETVVAPIKESAT